MKSLLTNRCQQCFATIPKRLLSGTLQAQLNTRLTLIQSTSFKSQPQYQQVREAFLRAGPGREHGASLSKDPIENPLRQSDITHLNSDIPTPPKLTQSSSPTTPYKEIVLLETDFSEKFIKGGGNGGQKINKTNSNVELKHLETGIVIQCQATRSLSQNRKIARKILIGRLDEYYNGEMSKRGQKAEKIRQRKMRMSQKSAKKYHNDEKTHLSEIHENDDIEDSDDVEDKPPGDRLSVPDIKIQLTTLEEILSSDNKKVSRRKLGRKE